MRAIIQRVSSASVSVDGELVNSIGKGLCVLIGIGTEDTPDDADFIARKLLNLRLFESSGPDGKRWERSLKDENLELLCISQFTLHAVLKGNKPDFRRSMGPDAAPGFYAAFLEKLRRDYEPEKVKDGRFGARMSVAINNEGPVTITLDSRQKEK